MTSPADRSPEIARRQADACAARIRADLDRRKRQDPALYENLLQTYAEQGYAQDGYPLGYPDHLKTLD